MIFANVPGLHHKAVVSRTTQVLVIVFPRYYLSSCSVIVPAALRWRRFTADSADPLRSWLVFCSITPGSAVPSPQHAPIPSVRVHLCRPSRWPQAISEFIPVKRFWLAASPATCLSKTCWQVIVTRTVRFHKQTHLKDKFHSMSFSSNYTFWALVTLAHVYSIISKRSLLIAWMSFEILIIKEIVITYVILWLHGLFACKFC